jgi:hypothetical protein
MEQQSCPFKIGPTGRDVYAEAAGIMEYFSTGTGWSLWPYPR